MFPLFCVCFVDETREKLTFFFLPFFAPKNFSKKKTGDHLHTNYHTLFTFLRSKGYFVDILGSTFDCFSAEDYGKRISSSLFSGFFFSSMKEIQKAKKTHLSFFTLSLPLLCLSLSYFSSLPRTLQPRANLRRPPGRRRRGGVLLERGRQDRPRRQGKGPGPDRLRRLVQRRAHGVAAVFRRQHQELVDAADGGGEERGGGGGGEVLLAVFLPFLQERERGTHQHTAHLSLSLDFSTPPKTKKNSPTSRPSTTSSRPLASPSETPSSRAPSEASSSARPRRPPEEAPRPKTEASRSTMPPART